LALDLCIILSIEPDDWLQIGAVLMKLSLVIKFNCTKMYCSKANYNAKAFKATTLHLGQGLFLASSLMNHCLNANTYQVAYGTTTVFRARRPIKKGERITFCFLESASYEERRKALMEDYKFKCRLGIKLKSYQETKLVI
jgi:hypothetical protein